MCGIAGFYNYSDSAAPASVSLVERMCDVLTHRGPDDAGTYTVGSLAMGMRRLSVVDITGGHQPISNEDGTVWLVYNGEIYNFADLRQELTDRGHTFRTRTDSEVVVHAYEEWHVDCLSRFRGMFAFALWDDREQRLLIARDQLGIKPLFYRDTGAEVTWASEIKAILVGPRRESRADFTTIEDYLRFRFVPAPRTFVRDIRKLPPGHYLVCRRGEAPRLTQYWQLPTRTDAGSVRSARSWASELRARLEDSVRRQLVSDVPLGAFLSGGIDSSTVVGLMTRISGRPIQTFSAGFGGEALFNELPHARQVAAHFRTNHHEIVVEPSSFELLSRIVWHLDEPVADPAAIPTFLLSQFAREFVTVVLTGEGADELFAGYRKYHWSRIVSRLRRLPLRARSVALGSLGTVRVSERQRRTFERWMHAADGDRILDMMTDFSSADAAKLLSPEARTAAVTGAELTAVDDVDELAAMLRADLALPLPDDLLLKVDRMTMAASLEARVPFLDHTLVEFAAQIPSNLKLSWGVGKRVLRRAVSDLLPPSIVHRRKQVFAVPLEHWFSASLRTYVMDLLRDARTRARGYFDGHAVEALAQRFWKGDAAVSQPLFTVIVLELWSRLYLDRSVDDIAIPSRPSRRAAS